MNYTHYSEVIEHNIARINAGADEATREQLTKINAFLYSVIDFNLDSPALREACDEVMNDEIENFFEF